MTTRIEAFNYRTYKWQEIRRLAPGEHTTFSQNVAEGMRSLYKVECAEDDSATSISISMNPGDIVLSRTERFVPQTADFEEVTTLKAGEVYEIELKREFTPLPAKVRVEHLKD